MTLREIRLTKGYKQKFIVEYLNSLGLPIQKTAFSAKENGKRPFSAKELQALCEFYGVDVGEVKLL